MINKLPKTRTELEALVLAELRAAPQCSSAVHVTVVPYDNYRVPATWELPVSTRARPSGKSVSAHCVTSLVASSSGLISPGEVRPDQKTTQRFAKATT